jgi:hypothetical protein
MTTIFTTIYLAYTIPGCPHQQLSAAVADDWLPLWLGHGVFKAENYARKVPARKIASIVANDNIEAIFTFQTCCLI